MMDTCLCCTLRQGAIISANYALIAYAAAFGSLIWWLYDSEGDASPAAYVLIVIYFVQFLSSLILALSLAAQRKVSVLVLWMVVMCFCMLPECALNIYLDVLVMTLLDAAGLGFFIFYVILCIISIGSLFSKWKRKKSKRRKQSTQGSSIYPSGPFYPFQVPYQQLGLPQQQLALPPPPSKSGVEPTYNLQYRPSQPLMLPWYPPQPNVTNADFLTSPDGSVLLERSKQPPVAHGRGPISYMSSYGEMDSAEAQSAAAPIQQGAVPFQQAAVPFQHAAVPFQQPAVPFQPQTLQPQNLVPYAYPTWNPYLTFPMVRPVSYPYFYPAAPPRRKKQEGRRSVPDNVNFTIGSNPVPINKVYDFDPPFIGDVYTATIPRNQRHLPHRSQQPIYQNQATTQPRPPKRRQQTGRHQQPQPPVRQISRKSTATPVRHRHNQSAKVRVSSPKRNAPPNQKPPFSPNQRQHPAFNDRATSRQNPAYKNSIEHSPSKGFLYVREQY